jgi:hypothetical protein
MDVSERAERLRDAFAHAEIPVELSKTIRRALWEKYLLICAVGGTTAVTRETIGIIRDTPATWRLFRMIVEEVAALARASGVDLASDAVDQIMKFAETIPPGNRASLAHDLLQGRRLELEALHGHAARLGERLGVPTPAIFAVYALAPHAAGGAAEVNLRAHVARRAVWRYVWRYRARYGIGIACLGWRPTPPHDPVDGEACDRRVAGGCASRRRALRHLTRCPPS